jgi:hypothetical protein
VLGEGSGQGNSNANANGAQGLSRFQERGVRCRVPDIRGQGNRPLTLQAIGGWKDEGHLQSVVQGRSYAATVRPSGRKRPLGLPLAICSLMC